MTGISSRKDFGHCFAPDLISPEVFIARVRGHCPGHANVVFAGVDVAAALMRASLQALLGAQCRAAP
jgi:hypothetical protein